MLLYFFNNSYPFSFHSMDFIKDSDLLFRYFCRCKLLLKDKLSLKQSFWRCIYQCLLWYQILYHFMRKLGILLMIKHSCVYVSTSGQTFCFTKLFYMINSRINQLLHDCRTELSYFLHVLIRHVRAWWRRRILGAVSNDTQVWNDLLLIVVCKKFLNLFHLYI